MGHRGNWSREKANAGHYVGEGSVGQLHCGQGLNSTHCLGRVVKFGILLVDRVVRIYHVWIGPSICKCLRLSE